MKKLFISQPMRGLTDEQILKNRIEYVREATHLVDEPVVVVPSFIKDGHTSEVSNSPLYYLGESLQMMSKADLVYFANGWHEARGCKIEHDCAVAYGMKIIRD